MKNNFSFKNLLKRMADIFIPKEFIYFGIGIVLIVLIGLVVSNMYLQEMLFLEGQEKSVQMFTEEELREYGDLYKELSLKFQNEIGVVIQGYANRTNRIGEEIHYGVYNHEHPKLNEDKIYKHVNGENVNVAGDNHISDIDDSYNDFPDTKDEWATYIDSDEFKNGVVVKYVKTEGRDLGESNFQDILTAVSILTDQKQTRDGNNKYNVNIKEEIPELITKLFKMSHTFSGTSKELYSCEKGCRVLFYYCNEEDNNYKGTGIDLKPFEIRAHDYFEDYDSSSDFEIVSAENECEICGHNGKGCVVDSAKCYHGREQEDAGCKHVMGSDMECSNPQPHYICSYNGDGEHDCSDIIIGCSGHYDCMGHEHYNCRGHFYVCCTGHTDVTINIHIMYIDEMLNIIKTGFTK